MIVGVMGPSGCGKDTFADYVVKNYNGAKVAMADPLKRICRDVYGFSDKQLWGPSEERNKQDFRYPIPGKGHLSPRVALQTLGTEWGRGCYENTWVDLAIRIAKQVLSGSHSYDQKLGVSQKRFWEKWLGSAVQHVIIPDVRFKNELDAVHAAKGVIIRLKRVGVTGDVGVKNHASEMEQKSIQDHEVDFILPVIEGIETYYRDIDALMNKLPSSRRSRRG